jgi:hypothetical protein
MTEQDFINLHTNNGPLSTTGTINVNFDLIPGTSIGRVTGITVTNIPQINPPNVSTFPDLVRVLEEVTDVKFRVGGTLYTLAVEDRRAYTNPTNDALSFFYFKVTPFEFSYDPNSTIQQDVSVSLYPFLLGSKFTFSDYNPVIDNVIEQRRVASGSRIVESDRNNTTVAPSNLNAILSGSATLAAVQESNYTSTGWGNGRYRGSKTNSKNYGGIPATLSGRTFSGAIYAPQTLDSFIQSQSFSTRILQNMFHTGREQTPTFEIINTTFVTATLINDTETSVPINVTYGSVPTGSFDINTLIKIDQEKMRVTDYIDNKNGTFLGITRGLFDTLPATHNGSSGIAIIAPTFIYVYDSVRRRENAVSNAKIWVEETEKIYYTDAFGAVYTGSL